MAAMAMMTMKMANTGMSGKKATDARGSFSRAMQMATQARSAMAQTVQIVPMM
jgi:hypothetical protein